MLAVTMLPFLASCGDDGSSPKAEDHASSLPSTAPSTSAAARSDCASGSSAPAQKADPAVVTGTLQGHLYGVGGPAPGVHEAWPGTITITRGETEQTADAGPDGAYAITLPAGTYAIVGHSPRFGDCAYRCISKPNKPQSITAGRTTTIDVYCPMK
jgi:hypothetical protein